MIDSSKACPTLLHILLIGLVLTGCNSQGAQTIDDNVLSNAEDQATAIIQQAQATALVLQAQAQATEMMASMNSRSQETHPAVTVAAPLTAPPSTQVTSAEKLIPDAKKDETAFQEVKLLGVGFAAEGGFIVVRFLAPPEEAEKWWQGSVSVTDETTENVYNEIPVMPKIGPIIGRPKRYGQTGYVMLTNTAPQLQVGTLVTVQLGNYIFEHILVE